MLSKCSTTEVAVVLFIDFQTGSHEVTQAFLIFKIEVSVVPNKYKQSLMLSYQKILGKAYLYQLRCQGHLIIQTFEKAS